jgi:hypothetical protein
METTIMAKKIPVKLLITELDRRILKEKDEKYAALERRLQNIEKSLQK